MAPADHQPAQLNIALPQAPIDFPLLADFVSRSGPTPCAYTFKVQFGPAQQLLIEDEIGCPA